VFLLLLDRCPLLPAVTAAAAADAFPAAAVMHVAAAARLAVIPGRVWVLLLLLLLPSPEVSRSAIRHSSSQARH
jgi:hypothetical protein